MSKRTRTHFVVNVDGIPRELFSVHDKINGDNKGTLRIILRHAEFYRDGVNRPRIKNHYFSVHPTMRTDGNLIHQTITLENGISIDTPRFSHALRDGNFATLMDCLPPILSIERYEYRGLSKDSREIGAFSQATGNILWSISISKPGVGIFNRDKNLNYFFEDFSMFRVNLLTSYIGVIASSNGDRIHHLTGAPGIKGGQRPPIIPVKTDGDSSDEVERLTAAQFHALHIQALNWITPTGEMSETLISKTAPRATPH